MIPSSALRLVVRARAPVTRAPDPVSGACFARSRSPWPPPFAPPAPQHRRRIPPPPCSSASQLLLRGRLRLLAFPTRTGGLRPSGRTQTLPVPRDKERLHMPGSSTTPGRQDARDIASLCVAFRWFNGVGTQYVLSFAAR